MVVQASKLTGAAEIASKLARVFQTRADKAREHFTQRVQKVYDSHLTEFIRKPTLVWDLWRNYHSYVLDSAQRSVLFLDTLRKRGNQYLEHELAGKPPVLHFDFETVLDARQFK